jgi:hypothetical protein
VSVVHTVRVGEKVRIASGVRAEISVSIIGGVRAMRTVGMVRGVRAVHWMSAETKVRTEMLVSTVGVSVSCISHRVPQRACEL